MSPFTGFVRSLANHLTLEFEVCEQFELPTEEEQGNLYYDESFTNTSLCEVNDWDHNTTAVFDVSNSCDTTGCEQVEFEVCEPNNPDECRALCTDPTDPSTCKEVCPGGYDCETETVYRGTCDCEATNAIPVTKRIPASLGACSDTVTCNNYGCVFNEDSMPGVQCDECSSDGCDHRCGPTDMSFERQTVNETQVCTDPQSCDPERSIFSERNVQCIQGTSPRDNTYTVEILGTDKPMVCTDQEDAMNQGDVFCPDGYVYRETYGECRKEQAVCDYGNPATSGLTNGCDNLTTGTDYWDLYNPDCVSNTDDPNSNVYDEACCYDVTFNDMDIYQQKHTEGFVKVY